MLQIQINNKHKCMDVWKTLKNTNNKNKNKNKILNAYNLFQYIDTKTTDTWLVLFFTLSTVILQIATRHRVKKYFSKK